MTAEQVIADALNLAWTTGQEWPDDDARIIAAALRAKGHLLGPDKVAVDREALRHVAEKSIEPSACHLCAEIAAALSEPQPKPEGTS